MYASVRRGLVAACVLSCVIAAAPAKADQIDDFFSETMAKFGLRSDGNAGIEYRERSPLVVPPKRDLPAPASSAALTNPAWPKDPDVEVAKDAANRKGLSIDDEANVLRGNQMTPGRKSGGKNARVQQQTNTPGLRDLDGNDTARPLRPDQLGYSGGVFGMFKTNTDETGKFTSEPPRENLTQPPIGYQTPSPNSPYGLGKDTTPTKAYDYKTQHGTDQN